ncbi:Protein AHNAK2, partial [Egretta garzetta]
KVDIGSSKVEQDSPLPKGDITLTKYQINLAESESKVSSLADENLSEAGVPILNEDVSLEQGILKPGGKTPVAEISVVDTEITVKIPKFRKPKFGISWSKGKPSEIDVGIKMHKPSSEVVVGVPTLDVSLPSMEVTKPKLEMEIHGSGLSCKAEQEVVSGEKDTEEKENKFKTPKFKLPSFSWSPKKEATAPSEVEGHLEEPTLPTLSGDTEPELTFPTPEDQYFHVEFDTSTEKDGEKGRNKKSQFIMPKISFPKIKGQKDQVSLPILETDVCGPKQEEESISAQKSEKGSRGEGAGMGIKMPKFTVSTLEFSKPEAKASKIEVDISMPTDPGVGVCKTKTPQVLTAGIEAPKVAISPQSVSKPVTEGAIESLEEKEIKLKEEHEIKVEEVQTEEHQGWFKMPKFRIPAFGRTSLKEKKVDADIERSMEKAQADVPPAQVQTEASIPENTFSLPQAVAEITVVKDGIPILGDSVKSSGASFSKMEGDVSLSTERTDSRVNIPKPETYADIVKHGAEEQKMPTSELTVPSAELSKSSLSASETDKDNSLTNRFPTCTLTLQEHEVKSQDIDVPKVESSTKLETSGVGSEMKFQKSEGSIGLKTPALDHMETSARITVEPAEKSQGGPEVNIKIPKLKIPRFTFKALPIEADVSVSKVVTDPKGSSTDIEVVQLQASSAIPEATPEALEGVIQKAKSKILTLTEPDIKTAQMTATIESSLSNAGQDIHWSYVEGQEVSEKVEPEHVAIERCEIYTTEIVKESEILSSEVKTAALGFSLLKVKLPESHSNVEVLVQQPSSTEDVSVSKPTCADESSGIAAQQTGSVELKPSDKPHSETEESSGEVSLPKLKTFAVEVKPPSKHEESLPDKSPERITAGPLSKDEDVAEALEDEEKDITNEKEKTDSKRSPGRFKFWLPSIGFSSSGDETSTDSKTEVKKSVPEDVKPVDTSDNDSSKQTEKTGWFRFPKLGFTSPSKKAKTVDKEEMGHKEGRISNEDSPSDKPDVFFDAQESLSPRETTEGEKIEIDGASSNVPVSPTIVTSSARTELILLEEEK